MLPKKLDEIFKFHGIIENEAEKIKWGMLTFNIFLKDNKPLISTINITRQKRRKYQLPTTAITVNRLMFTQSVVDKPILPT